MAEDLPDAPWIKQGSGGDLPDAPWIKSKPEEIGVPADTSPPDPGFLPAVGRFGRGAVMEGSRIAKGIGSHLPFFPGQQPWMPKDRPPKDWVERAGGYAGDAAALAMVPKFGLERLAGEALRAIQAGSFPTSMAFAKAIPWLERIGGGLLEGGAGGAVGGALMPGDTGKNAETGAAAGAAVRGTGAVIESSINALPRPLKNTVSALAALAAAKQAGVPLWTMFVHGPHEWGSVLSRLYNSNLADLAARWLEKGTGAIPPAMVGGAAAKVRGAIEGEQK